MTDCILVGIPVQDGAGRRGCDMGPNAFRAAGIHEALTELGHTVVDRGDMVRPGLRPVHSTDTCLKRLPEIVAWTQAGADAAYRESAAGMPIFLGGDHSLSAGTLTGLAKRHFEERRPFFVLWLDAHPDIHTLETTRSGNLHGVPVAYAAGMPGFGELFPSVQFPITPANIAMMGIRSVDPAERAALAQLGVTVHDMRAIDENGVAPLLTNFLGRVAEAGGALHLSLDVDFLDPQIAPGVGTTVPGGATFREAHLVMELLHDSGLVTSVDLAELNPFLDERGRTATLMVDLLASLMGRQIFDRPTRSYGA